MFNEDTTQNPADPPEIWGPPPVEFTDPDEGRNGPAWEWRHELGFWRALTLTLREVLLAPGQCFRLARRTGGLSQPLAFNILMALLVMLIFVGVNLMIFLIAPALAARLFPDIFNAELFAQIAQSNLLITLTIGLVVFWIVLLILSIAIAVKVLVIAAIFHLGLLFLGGARQGFEATFRTVAYVDGATTMLNLIPWIGKFMGIVYFMILAIRGLKRMHETQAWKCALAVLVPTTFFLVFVFTVMGFLLMADTLAP